ncbi:acyl-CoA dehydrogenase family protein [Nocardia sp. NPDC050378]|uniref:acyl-CoA dehydrogenase family protein n=1 Tax=Nocardia sp. NPDC050378 TaxID=3155400 RepID=UPI0033E4D911
MTSTTQPNPSSTSPGHLATADGIGDASTGSGIPTHDEIIERAHALLPFLREHQEATERNTFPIEEVHQAFLDNGFYKVLTPKRYGGYQMGPWTFLKLAIELARGCPSAAWCYALGHAKTLTAAAYFPPEVQDELFAAEDGYFVSAAFAYPRGDARRVEGGYIVNGKYPYSSGSPYANYHIAVVPAPAGSPHGPEGSHLTVVIKRDDFTIGDDWGNVLGMRGSGSATVTVTEAFVPDHWVLTGSFTSLGADENGTFGSRYHEDSTYAIPELGFASALVPALVIGMGYGMLDAYEQVITTRSPEKMPGILDPSLANAKVKADASEYQRIFGLASMDIESAEAIMRVVADELIEMGSTPGSTDLVANFRLAALTSKVGRLVWDAVQEHLWRTGGSSQTADTAPMQRYFRDVATYWTAVGNGQRDSIAQTYGYLKLFGAPTPPAQDA